MDVDLLIYFNNVDTDECVAFMMELLHLHDEVELLHIFADTEKAKEEKSEAKRRRLRRRKTRK